MEMVPDKEWVVTSSTDKTIQVWDLKQQRTISKLQLNEAVQKFVLTSPDHLVYSNSSGQIMEWELNHSENPPKVLYANTGRIPYQTIAYNATHNWLVTTSLGDIIVFSIDPDHPENLKPEGFTVKHKGVIQELEFSPDNNWLVSASQDAIMLWDLREMKMLEINKYVPIVIDNNRLIFSLAFDTESKYILYGDNRILHLYPINIEDLYTKLKLVTGGKELSEQEWNYYIKGELERPVSNDE